MLFEKIKYPKQLERIKKKEKERKKNVWFSRAKPKKGRRRRWMVGGGG